MQNILSRWTAIRTKVDPFLPASIFLGGLFFDIFTIGRIDDWFIIGQQVVYLVLLALIVGLEIRWAYAGGGGRIAATRLWGYREFVAHFLFGSLLSTYTLFYFRSASPATMIGFFALLVSLLVANEFEYFQRLGGPMRVALLSFCVSSFLMYLVPILFGYVGVIPFVVAWLGAVGLLALFARETGRGLTDPSVVKRKVLVPGLSVPGIILVLYFLQAIPPVPLALSYMGIFHNVARAEGKYELSYRPTWKFWQHGNQEFLARPGDAIYCYFRIFSPTKFRDRIVVRWMSKDAKGRWQGTDAIPVEVLGGREEGYRAYTSKKNFQPGRWRVRVETGDGRVVGQMNFWVETDSSEDVRQMTVQRD